MARAKSNQSELQSYLNSAASLREIRFIKGRIAPEESMKLRLCASCAMVGSRDVMAGRHAHSALSSV